MLRILFILLAVVSTILGFVLEQPLLYAAAGLLLLVAVVVLIGQAQRRRTRARERQPRAPLSKQEELSALGIVEIRPKEKTGGPRPRPAPPSEQSALPVASKEEREEPTPVPAEAAVTAGQPELEQPRGRTFEPAATARVKTPQAVTVRRKDPAANSQDNSPARPKKEVLTATLHALQVAIDANTVCLLKQEEFALRYFIEAIVSKNHYARTQGYFSTKVPLLTPGGSRKTVILLRVGEKELSASNLGYYIEPIAVRQVALATVPHPSELMSYFLLADTMEEDGLATARQRRLLARFAELLGSILDMRESEAQEAEDVSDPRPRRDIIAEEMEHARVQERPLAMALIYFNRAEETSARGPAALAEAEGILEARLREGVGRGRIERFGELTYGAFYNEDVADVEAWALQLQRALAEETGPLEGGVSIGIAMLQDRHRDPDQLRADAMDALREAYETGACTILA